MTEQGEEYQPDPEFAARVAGIDEAEAEQRAQSLRAGLESYELDAEDLALLDGGEGAGDTEEAKGPAPVLAIVEIANELAEQGLETFDPNLGGTVQFDWGWVKLVPAWHTSTTPNGTVCTPAGLLIHIGGKLVYHYGVRVADEHEQLTGFRREG